MSEESGESGSDEGVQEGRLDHEEEAGKKAKDGADAIPLQEAEVLVGEGHQLPRKPAEPAQY